MSAASRTRTAVNCTPTVGAASSSARRNPLFGASPCCRRAATLVVLGVISLSSSNHFRRRTEFEVAEAGEVAAGPCQAFDQATAHRIDNLHEHHWNGAGGLPQRGYNRRAIADDHIRLERH